MSETRPVYLTLTDDYSGPHGVSDDPDFALRPDFVEAVRGVPAVRSRWKCPFCKLQFIRRKPLESHTGMKMNVPASCSVLRAEEIERRERGKGEVA